MSQVDQKIRAIVGLGNPGKQYEETKHNAGFSVIDKLLNVLPGNLEYRQGFNGLYCRARVKGRKIILLKPLTFMNLSGISVLALCRKEKIIPAELMVIYDDMDLPLGKIRIRESGGSSGHNGVESIINNLNSNKFARLRVGIGKVTSKDMVDHVLSEFSTEEKNIFNKIVDLSTAAVKLSLYRDIHVAMNRYNNQLVKLENEL